MQGRHAVAPMLAWAGRLRQLQASRIVFNVLSEERVLCRVGCIYDAAADVESWPAFLEAFVDTVRGNVTAMFFCDLAAPWARFENFVRFDRYYARGHAAHYNSVNPWIQSWRMCLNRAGPESIGTSQERVGLGELERMEFYSDYPLLVHQIGSSLTKTNENCSAFTCSCPHRIGPFCLSDLKLFPHLQGVMHFCERVAALNTQYRASLDALNHQPTGTILN